MAKVAALTGQNAIDATAFKAAAEIAVDDVADQAGIDAAVDAYKVAIDVLITDDGKLEMDDSQTNEGELEDSDPSETIISDGKDVYRW